MNISKSHRYWHKMKCFTYFGKHISGCYKNYFSNTMSWTHFNNKIHYTCLECIIIIISLSYVYRLKMMLPRIHNYRQLITPLVLLKRCISINRHLSLHEFILTEHRRCLRTVYLKRMQAAYSTTNSFFQSITGTNGTDSSQLPPSQTTETGTHGNLDCKTTNVGKGQESDGLKLIYSYPKLSAARKLQNRQILQLALTTAAVPYLCFLSAYPVGIVAPVSAGFLLLTYILSYSAWKARKTIMLLYLDERNKTVKLSFVDRRGRRVDVVKNVSDIVPVMDIEQKLLKKKIFVVKTYQQDKYYLSFESYTEEEKIQLKKVIGNFSRLQVWSLRFWEGFFFLYLS